MPAAMPIISAPMGFTKPEAGVIATRPATAPETMPSTDGFLETIHSTNIHDRVAAAGIVCYLSAVHMKKLFGYDDALDCWGVHGVGGALGAILTGVFASKAINSSAAKGGWLVDGNFHQMSLQLIDVGVVFAYCAVVTFVILAVLKYTIGIRVSEEVEVEGLDINLHGEVVHG